MKTGYCSLTFCTPGGSFNSTYWFSISEGDALSLRRDGITSDYTPHTSHILACPSSGLHIFLGTSFKSLSGVFGSVVVVARFAYHSLFSFF